MRNMSFSLTTPQVRARTKLVTRRLGWTFLRPKQHVRAVEKGQGLKKGEHVEHLDVIRIVSVRRERLSRLLDEVNYGFAEVAAEGFAGHPQYGTPSGFVTMFCATHGCKPTQEVTRIQFEYLEAANATASA